ncbi:hypothetical protein QJS10_CPB17g01980 [Acorus calamus]|uniref:Mitochondrial processing peptidase n=1 Tax=Acorus calamus TaxID=4465 RepID=A0AAV9CUZ3_ACOCL|nr:hypothetical protein QJS10_CPB17g01980 [Acorus calamus]
MDGPGAVAEDIGRQLLTYGRRMPLPELFARIDAVDASTVKRVANRFICDQPLQKRLHMAHFGPPIVLIIVWSILPNKVKIYE